MKRYAMELLIQWKNSKHRKPLILQGARQVGKTWLMTEFGKQFYENVAYVDFRNNRRMQKLFEGDFDIPRLIEGLQVETHEKITPEKTLIIFDEVQEAGLALTSLKYFYENAHEYHIVAGGSLLGVAVHEGISFPVGKVDFCNLYPLNFCEFLEGIGEIGLAELLHKNDWEMAAAFKTKFADYLRKYYFVGGMPECVSIYSEDRDYDAVRKTQNDILAEYEKDFSKHVPNRLIAKIRSVWANVPRLLARERNCFSPGVIKKGSRANEYADAIQWLVDAGLIYRVPRITKPAIPLKSYADDAFKIYMLDVGLLGAASELDALTLLEGDLVFTEFKGSLTENYVCQELTARGITPFYWSSERTAEVDFVFKLGVDILPLEAKAGENLQGKSLRIYYDKFNPKFAMRTSMKDYREESWMKNIPLYGIGVWE
ncbi:MAG: ATP-binding protein [Clostridiales Family XIII bacterium]|jgi:predicted AAA+ superfamily ATPase|nr:ATP-binding protein [Clostridiales Family XIII bacterium]